jgi:teichuronic acid biosynthesis glycosyltransferase TuaC
VHDCRLVVIACNGEALQPLKLLIVTEGYPWGQNVAGIFHRDQFRLIAQAGIDVTVVAPMPWVPPPLVERNPRWRSYAQAPPCQTDDALQIKRPRYLAVPRENAWFIPDIMRYVAIRRLQLPRPDVIQAYFAVPTGGAARLLARHWKVPYVIGMLGDDVNVYPLHNSRNRRLLKRVVEDARFAFANGPTLADRVAELTGQTVPWLSIGALPSRFANAPQRDEARARLHWPLDRTVALYVGAITPTKGIGELMAALDACSDRRFLTVAIGDGPLRTDLARKPDVLCPGVQPASDVALAMTAADFLVHPSHYEGLPTVLVEAAFARLPIVTTDAPGCIDLARDGRALMVPVGDAHALAAAIRQTIDDPGAASTRATRMLAHVRERYDLVTNAKQLVELYRELASRAA